MLKSESLFLEYLIEEELVSAERIYYTGDVDGLGWDFEVDGEDGVAQRAIEVKTYERGSAFVCFTRSEWEAARELGDSYWLYVFDMDFGWLPARVQNPYDKLGPARFARNRFYVSYTGRDNGRLL